MPLSNKQIRFLFQAYRQIALDEDDRHMLQREVTGKESLRIMQSADFEKLVRHLRDRGAHIDINVPPLHAGQDTSKHNLIRKLYAVWGTLAGTYYEPRYERRALRAFLKKRIGPSHENFCSVAQLIAAIEAIKAISARQARPPRLADSHGGQVEWD